MSKKLKLTPWFLPDTSPVHVGEYESKWLAESKPRKRKWNGTAWMHPLEPRESYLQNLYWRGLAVKP